MKQKKKRTMRKAIAMIELVFAIVIMGFVLLSVPSLISTANRSGYTALQQEAIAMTTSQLNLLLSMEWDEADANTSQNHAGAPVLRVSHGAPSLDFPRPGAEERGKNGEDFNGVVHDATPTLGPDGGDLDDLDDINGAMLTLRNYETTSIVEGDYIDQQIQVDSRVVYIDDRTSGANDYNNARSVQFNFAGSLPIPSATPTTNIKAISITLTTNSSLQELDKNITLFAFSCNIGSYDEDSKPLAARDL